MNILFTAVISAAFASRAAALLSIPQDSTDPARASKIQAASTTIFNIPRSHTTDNVTYPLNFGPGFTAASAGILQSEIDLFAANTNPFIEGVATLFFGAQPTSLDDFLPIYQAISQAFPIMPVSLGSFSISDEDFAYERRSTRISQLRKVDPQIIQSAADLNMTDAQVEEICGAGMSELLEQHYLFVTNYTFAGDFNELPNPFGTPKYSPSPAAFFCVTSDNGFMPLTIFLKDTNLWYTKFDSEEEWTLAKMAVNTANNNVQPMDHFAELHVMIEPIRVEMLRTLSPDHPVYVLMEHHFLQIFGNTVAGLNVLFSRGTRYDQLFGFGAPGALSYLGKLLREHDFNELDFKNLAERESYDKIPDFLAAIDGLKIREKILDFVRRYLSTFYRSDEVELNAIRVRDDVEIQNWASNLQGIAPGFPKRFNNVNHLAKTLVNIIHRVAVLHHQINNQAIWHQVALPYGSPSFWADLPTEKGVAVNPFDFILPDEGLRHLDLAIVSSSFVRNVTLDVSKPADYSLLFADFDLPRKAARAVELYEEDMKDIEEEILLRETGNPFFENLLSLPSVLPHYAMGLGRRRLVLHWRIAGASRCRALRYRV